MTIVWSPEALADIGAAVDYVAARNVSAAERLATGIVTLVERLATQPLEGPEHILSNGERVRGRAYPPFRVYYQRTPDAPVVLRVYHQRRAPIER